MPGRRPSTTEAPFLFLAFSSTGKIETASLIRVNKNDGPKAAKARAQIHGTTKYQMYRVSELGKDKFDFKRV